MAQEYALGLTIFDVKVMLNFSPYILGCNEVY